MSSIGFIISGIFLGVSTPKKIEIDNQIGDLSRCQEGITSIEQLCKQDNDLTNSMLGSILGLSASYSILVVLGFISYQSRKRKDKIDLSLLANHDDIKNEAQQLFAHFNERYNGSSPFAKFNIRSALSPFLNEVKEVRKQLINKIEQLKRAPQRESGVSIEEIKEEAPRLSHALISFLNRGRTAPPSPDNEPQLGRRKSF